jgi:hypothetical protein
MKQVSLSKEITNELQEGRTALVSYQDVCSDRLVRVINPNTPEQSLETLDRSEYFTIAPIDNEVAIQPVKDATA